ncbi:PH domain-containing protein [Rhodoferax sp.]|uniref:PH domain-containing protein n=1 Tax=Rhodoferax sp. TaxID=50421 RepID=UPI002743F452|nr:PH domain-containing protein [Rhodoferax sp.]
MTEPPASDIGQSEHRLHPWSWLFSASHQLKDLLLPLLAFVFLKRGDPDWLLLGALGAALTALWGVLRARCYRYRIGQGELLVRAGILDRTVRHVALERIQNVSQRRGPLHRLLGVTELRLESASGGKPEALMRVLGLAAAAELEDLLRGTSLAPGSSGPSQAAPAAPAQVLHRLSLGELMRHGLISNRGTLVLAAGIGLLAQSWEFLPRGHRAIGALLEPARQWFARELALQHWALLLVTVLAAMTVALLALRVFSIAYAVFRYHGFRLELLGERLHAEHGLLTTVRAGARLPRLQRLVLEQTLLHRLLRRCRLEVDVAGGASNATAHAEARLAELAPIATPEQAHALLRVCVPGLDLSTLPWQRLHPGTAARRMRGAARGLLAVTLLALSLDMLLNWWMPWPVLVGGALLWAWGAWAHARAWARFAGYAVHADWLVYRSGIWTRRWVIVMPERLQSVSLLESPFDRRAGMQRLRAEAQGGAQSGHALDIGYLSTQQARQLRDLVWARIAHA